MIFNQLSYVLLHYIYVGDILFLSRAARKGVDRNHLLSRSHSDDRDVGRVEWIRLATAHRGTVDHHRNRSRQARKSYCTANEHHSGIRIDTNLRYTSRREFIMITLIKTKMLTVAFIAKSNYREYVSTIKL